VKVGEAYILIVAAGLLWLLVSFHWGRILGIGFIMTVWGLAVVIGPLYLAGNDFKHGRFGGGILTLLVSLIPASLWVIAAQSARDWWVKTDKYGGLWLPWNAR
jgi:hypothetical protein